MEFGSGTNSAFSNDAEIVWRPPDDLAGASHLARFMRQHHIGSFRELLARSTEDIEWFWDAVLKELSIRFATPYSKAVDLSRGAAQVIAMTGAGVALVSLEILGRS